MRLVLLAIQLGMLLLLNAAVLYVFYQLIKLRRGDAPFVGSPESFLRLLIEKELLPKQGSIVDLGAGDGRVLRALARSGHDGPLLGYEYAWLPYLMGKIRNRVYRGRIRIIRRRFEDADLRGAKGVYAYLFDTVLRDLEPKLARELAPGARLVTPSFQIHGWTPSEIHETTGLGGRPTKIFVYNR
jgi:hypothetical protein